MKRMKWSWWYLVIAAIVAGLFLIHEYLNPFIVRKLLYKHNLETPLRGVLLNKSADPDNPDYKSCIILNQTDTISFLLDFDRSGLFMYLQAGDSILKNSGDSLLTVKRRNQIKQFYIDCGK